MSPKSLSSVVYEFEKYDAIVPMSDGGINHYLIAIMQVLIHVDPLKRYFVLDDSSDGPFV